AFCSVPLSASRSKEVGSLASIQVTSSSPAAGAAVVGVRSSAAPAGAGGPPQAVAASTSPAAGTAARALRRLSFMVASKGAWSARGMRSGGSGGFAGAVVEVPRQRLVVVGAGGARGDPVLAGGQVDQAGQQGGPLPHLGGARIGVGAQRLGAAEVVRHGAVH